LQTGVEAVRAAIDALGVEYEWIDIDPALADTAAFCARYGYPLDKSANTIVVASRREPFVYVACVVLATTRLDVNGTVRRLMGVNKASFATAEQMVAVTGMEPGGVTPFALPAGLPLLIDASVMACDWVIVGAGGRAAKVRVAPAILAGLPGAGVVEGLALAKEQVDTQ
jgi:prolyl-tRNA editing enzyme YbaK/EbsC (Cys-tRNA(Pro) deacylase)